MDNGAVWFYAMASTPSCGLWWRWQKLALHFVAKNKSAYVVGAKHYAGTKH